MSIIQGIIGSLQGGRTYGYQAASFGARPGWGNPQQTGPSGVGSVGTPFDPGNNLSSVPGSPVNGALRRTAYNGLWANNGSYYSLDHPEVFNGTEQEIISDSHIAFNNDNTINDYCFQWKGYWQAPTTANWNFSCNADDVAYIWLGSAALAPDITNYLCRGTDSWNANSVSVTAGQWYPIRIWYQEWGGSETLNVYAGEAGTTMQALFVNSSRLSWNGSSAGY